MPRSTPPRWARLHPKVPRTIPSWSTPFMAVKVAHSPDKLSIRAGSTVGEDGSRRSIVRVEALRSTDGWSVVGTTSVGGRQIFFLSTTKCPTSLSPTFYKFGSADLRMRGSNFILASRKRWWLRLGHYLSNFLTGRQHYSPHTCK